jgi:hypothetical protein
MTWDGFTRDLRTFLRGISDGDVEPLILVTASPVPPVELFHGESTMTSSWWNTFYVLRVPPFPIGEARRFLTDRLTNTGVTFSPDQVDQLLQETGGHPARLQRAAADLYRRLARGDGW